MRKILLIYISILSANSTFAQTDNRVINTAAPFLLIPSSAVGLAKGNTGVASGLDDNTCFYNPAKIAFQKQIDVFSASYIPWMHEYSNDLKLVVANYSYKKDEFQSFGAGITYFNMGNMVLKDENGTELGVMKSNEFAIAGTYARALSYNTSIALTMRGIYSSILRSQGYSMPDVKPAWGISADISMYKTIELDFDRNFNLGFNLSNIGPKLNYGRDALKTSLPTNLRMGFGYDCAVNEDNGYSIGLDINKLLVPSPPELDQTGQIIKGKNPGRSYLNGLFSSFYDAPNGLKEELQEVNICFGGEYRFKDAFAFRAGASYESKVKGNRTYIGAGFEYKFSLYDQKFGLSFCYLAPLVAQSPLKNTFGMTAYIRLGEADY